jgi:hypothetical protein
MYVTQTSSGCTNYDQMSVTVGQNGCKTFTTENQVSLNKYILFPSPSTGQMQFTYEIEEGDEGKLLLFDLMGKQLSSYSLQPGENTLSINEEKLPDGIYFYRVVINDAVVKTDKFSIVR